MPELPLKFGVHRNNARGTQTQSQRFLPGQADPSFEMVNPLFDCDRGQVLLPPSHARREMTSLLVLTEPLLILRTLTLWKLL